MTIPVLVAEGQHPVGQVAPGGDQFVVVPGDEFRPIPVGILVFGHVDGQVVAQGIRVVAGQGIAAPDGPVAAAGDLLAFQVHELVGRHIVGQGQSALFLGKDLQELLAGAHQLGRPHGGMEEDVVLADEVEGLRGRIDPPVFPGLRLAADLGPLDRRREIADDRLEPDVQAFVRPSLPPGPGCPSPGRG